MEKENPCFQDGYCLSPDLDGEEFTPPVVLPRHLIEVDYTQQLRYFRLLIPESHQRSGKVTIDVNQIKLVDMEPEFSAYDYIKRLESIGGKPLDVKILEEFLLNPKKIKEEWPEIGKRIYVYFLGIPLKDPGKPEKDFASVLEIRPSGILNHHISDLNQKIGVFRGNEKAKAAYLIG